MIDARIRACSSAVLLVFLMQQQFGSTVEEFSSDGTSIFQDFISSDQQTLSTVATPRQNNSGDFENYYEIESMPSGKNLQKYNKGIDVYRDISHIGYNNKRMKGDRGSFTSKSSDEENQSDDVDGHQSTNTKSNDYEDWVTNRRGHSTFERHKAHHRNYRRYGHKSYRRNFGKYIKYEHHHRGKHKAILHHQLHHPFNQKPYYQGQVIYYGNDDTSDGRADKSLHLPAKKARSHQHYQQHIRRIGASGRHHNIPSDEYSSSNQKWPHLSRIEYQISEDERREKGEQDKLPPYIRKYNRRNKQLLDLLEGTLPPSTIIPFGTVQKSDKDESSFGNISDENRETSGHIRYHNHKNSKWIMEDLFEEQRANPNNPNIEADQYLNDSAMSSKLPESFEVEGSELKGNHHQHDANDHMKIIRQNELPSDSISTSQDSSKRHNGLLRGPPSVNLPQHENVTSHKTRARATPPKPTELVISPKANLFIFHRVASPRAVGTGTNVMRIGGASKKQSLPFVAITERRIETSKIKQKDFQQNHLPLP